MHSLLDIAFTKEGNRDFVLKVRDVIGSSLLNDA